MAIEYPIAVLKTVWERGRDGRWMIADIKSLTLSSQDGSEESFFLIKGDLELMSKSPRGRVEDIMSLMGPVEFLMQQSVVPVVAWLHGDHSIRSIGTASIISCSGFLLTAAHVLMDPLERGYGATRDGNAIVQNDNLHFGVLIPGWRPGRGMTFEMQHIFFPFEGCWLWGEWQQSPLLHEEDRWSPITDLAICKIREMPGGGVHQPLNLSLNSFVEGEDAYALGYAEMPDIQLDRSHGGFADKSFRLGLYASVGNILSTFPQNHVDKNVPTPGPCFDFDARIPGKMSGAPIFGARGTVVRGVVSRSFSAENHAYGSMLGPVMELPLSGVGDDDLSLRDLLETGNDGMSIVHGHGL